MLTMADKGGRGVGEMLTIADEGGGGVYTPSFLPDIICEPPLIYVMPRTDFNYNTFIFWEMWEPQQ